MSDSEGVLITATAGSKALSRLGIHDGFWTRSHLSSLDARFKSKKNGGKID